MWVLVSSTGIDSLMIEQRSEVQFLHISKKGNYIYVCVCVCIYILAIRTHTHILCYV